MNKSPSLSKKKTGVAKRAAMKAYPSASMGGTQEFRRPKQQQNKENLVKRGTFRKSPELQRGSPPQPLRPLSLFAPWPALFESWQPPQVPSLPCRISTPS